MTLSAALQTLLRMRLRRGGIDVTSETERLCSPCWIIFLINLRGLQLLCGAKMAVVSCSMCCEKKKHCYVSREFCLLAGKWILVEFTCV